MKIIELAAHGGFGGGERVMADLIFGLKETIDFIVMAPPGPMTSHIEKTVSVHRLVQTSVFRRVLAIRRCIIVERPDVLHCHGTRAAIWGRFAVIGLRHRPRVIYTLHGFHLPKYKEPLRKGVLAIEFLLNKYVDTLVCVSEQDKNTVLRLGLQRENKLVVIENGVDVDLFSQPRTPRNNPTIVCVARLHEPKDHESLLQAFQHVLQVVPMAQLLLVGDGPKRKDLQAKSIELGIHHAVTFLGDRFDIPTILATAHIAVLPTHWEGLPLAPLEAAAAGLPVVVSNVPGACETVKHEVTGFLYEDGNVEDLSSRLIELLQNTERAQRMGLAGRAMVEERFSLQRMLEKYRTIYEEQSVLQVVKFFAPVIGGVETVAGQAAYAAAMIGESRVLCCDTSNNRTGPVTVSPIRIVRSNSIATIWGMPVSIDFFRHWLRERRVEVVDVHMPFPLADVAMTLFPPKGRLIVHYHSDIVRQKAVMWFFRPFIHVTLKRAEQILVSSPNLLASSELLAPFQHKARVVPFGIDRSRFENVDPIRVHTIKQKYGDFVLYVGRFGYYKGLTYLIDAIKEVDCGKSGVGLVLIGSGPEQASIERKITQHGLAHRVTILPFQKEEDLPAFYAAARVFVLPSLFRSEAFGLVLMEALAAGTPCISTELGTGTSYVNTHEETGLVVPPGDSHALAQAIDRLVGDDAFHAACSRRAKERVKALFDERQMVDTLQGIYTRLP